VYPCIKERRSSVCRTYIRPIAIAVCEHLQGNEITQTSVAETPDNLALKKSELVEHFERLKTDQQFEAMAQTPRSLTLQNFGRTMRLFAPLYLSNECINNCRYCGFSRDNQVRSEFRY
jgi:2-iminoacetate synthase ThiH